MNDTFYLAALTVVCGAIVFLIRSCFASKCIRFKCGFGCIDVTRDVDMEMPDIRQQETVAIRSRCNSDVELEIEEEKGRL